MAVPPSLDNENPSASSVFVPAALMREARRQKNIKQVDVPSVCLPDPDGDLVRHLRRTGRAKPFEGWPCYHTNRTGPFMILNGYDVCQMKHLG